MGSEQNRLLEDVAKFAVSGGVRESEWIVVYVGIAVVRLTISNAVDYRVGAEEARQHRIEDTAVHVDEEMIVTPIEKD